MEIGEAARSAGTHTRPRPRAGGLNPVKDARTVSKRAEIVLLIFLATSTLRVAFAGAALRPLRLSACNVPPNLANCTGQAPERTAAVFAAWAASLWDTVLFAYVVSHASDENSCNDPEPEAAGMPDKVEKHLVVAVLNVHP